MADIVNPQITDAVTQSNVKVVAESPAIALGALYQSLAHSTGIMFENAVAAQQNQAILAQAATTQGVMQIYSLGAGVDALAAAKLAQSDVPDNLLSLLTALRAVGPAVTQNQAVDAALAAVKALTPEPVQTASSKPAAAKPASAKPRG
jgi:hypothetical protein